MKVSIIVPVYNSSKYLCACLDSLVKQTLKDIEIIAIDDNSTDNSLEILKEYQKRYKNKIKILHNQKNLGPSITRNRGISIAQGEYIGFVDSDDYINYKMYQRMYEEAIQYNFPEIITTGICFVKNNYYLESDFSFIPSNRGKVYNVLENPNLVLEESPSVCNKLFRKDIIQNGLFLEGKMWEDIAFSFAKMFNASRILRFRDADYFYRRRLHEGVTSQCYSINPHLLDIFNIADQIEIETKEHKRYEILKQPIKFIQITACLERVVEIMTWPIPEDKKENLCLLMSNIIIKKYGDWRLIPIEELSSRIGFFELEKLQKIINANNTKFPDQDNELNILKRNLNKLSKR